MGNLLDRMRDKGRLDSTQSTTLAQADAPVIQRTKLVLDYFADSVTSRNDDDPKSKRVSFLLKKVAQDAIEEASEVPPEIMELYMAQAAAVLYYAATGEVIVNMPLPEDFPEVTPELAPVFVGELES